MVDAHPLLPSQSDRIARAYGSRHRFLNHDQGFVSLASGRVVGLLHAWLLAVVLIAALVMAQMENR